LASADKRGAGREDLAPLVNVRRRSLAGLHDEPDCLVRLQVELDTLVQFLWRGLALIGVASVSSLRLPLAMSLTVRQSTIGLPQYEHIFDYR